MSNRCLQELNPVNKRIKMIKRRVKLAYLVFKLIRWVLSSLYPAWRFACCYLPQPIEVLVINILDLRYWLLSKFSALSSNGIRGSIRSVNARHLLVWVYHEWCVRLYVRRAHKTSSTAFFTKHRIKHLITGRKVNSEFCLHETLNIEVEGKQNSLWLVRASD